MDEISNQMAVAQDVSVEEELKTLPEGEKTKIFTQPVEDVPVEEPVK
jgi:hypothetical protein